MSKNLPTVQCKKCGYDCMVDGVFPHFDTWCDNCNAPPEGFDLLEYATEYLGSQQEEPDERY